MQTIEGRRAADGDRPHIWMQEEGEGPAVGPCAVRTSTPAAAETRIVPFAPPSTYPFIPGPVEGFCLRWRRAGKILFKAGAVLGAWYCARLALSSFDGLSWPAFLVAAIAAVVVLAVACFIGVAARAFMRDIAGERVAEAVTSYLESSGWDGEGDGLGRVWTRDLGLGSGLLQMRRGKEGVGHWHLYGQCHPRDAAQLRENLSAVVPGLNIDPTYWAKRLYEIDLTEPPDEDARLDELGYGQSGWVGLGAVLSRHGDPAFSEHITATIHRKAFVRQARDERHTVLVYVCCCFSAEDSARAYSLQRIEEAKGLAVARARQEGAPPDTLIAVVKHIYRDEKTPALLLKLDGEGGG